MENNFNSYRIEAQDFNNKTLFYTIPKKVNKNANLLCLKETCMAHFISQNHLKQNIDKLI